MSNLLIRNLPPELHAKLREVASAHRRSMNQQAILLLEKGFQEEQLPPVALPPPMVPRRPITMEQTLGYANEGRP